MTSQQKRGAGTAADYQYRRALTLPELLPAFGVAAGIAAAAFYVTRLFLQRTPLVPAPDIPTLGPPAKRIARELHGASRHRPRSESRKPFPPIPPPPTITRRNARRVDAG